MENKEVQLRIKEAKQRDVGRSIIRVDNESMKILNLKTGDIVGIKGKRLTAAIAWPAYPEDQDKKIIRMDGRLRKNAGISIGELINIYKIEEKIAERVVVASTEVTVESDPYLENFVKRKLLNYPIIKGDILFVPIGISKNVSFQILMTKPSGVVVIKPTTELRVQIGGTEEESKKLPFATFENIGGLNEQIKKIREIVELPHKHPELFYQLGVTITKTILLYGPSGCGKNLLVRALANELDYHFIYINGPEFYSKFFAESEKKLRSIFEDAQKNAPSIIFFDELDSIAPKIEIASAEYKRSIVAQLLTLIDNLHERGKIFLIGATRHPDSLDLAFRRPGRFDVEIEFPMPDQNARKEILQIHTKLLPLDDNIDLEKIADESQGYTGADIAALTREVAMHAVRRVMPDIILNDSEILPEILNKLKITREDFEAAQKMFKPSSSRDKTIKLTLESLDNERRNEEEKKIKEKLKDLLSAKFIKEITYERISNKLKVDINDIQDLIEILLKSGEIKGIMLADKIILESNE